MFIFFLLFPIYIGLNSQKFKKRLTFLFILNLAYDSAFNPATDAKITDFESLKSF